MESDTGSWKRMGPGGRRKGDALHGKERASSLAVLCDNLGDGF